MVLFVHHITLFVIGANTSSNAVNYLLKRSDERDVVDLTGINQPEVVMPSGSQSKIRLPERYC
jgi:hypothetical protein